MLVAIRSLLSLLAVAVVPARRWYFYGSGITAQGCLRVARLARFNLPPLIQEKAARPLPNVGITFGDVGQWFDRSG